jgi:REP element-mobilizing transposase RayT
MPDYRRNRVPGGTFFFTVNLLDRRSNLLVARIDAVRDAVRQVRARAPFHIDAWVVLPDHMHCLWTLPQGDADFPGRWRAIKTAFAKSLPIGEPRSPVMTSRGERGIWQRRCWEHTSAMIATSLLTWTTRISTRSSAVSWRTRRIGRIRRFIGASAAGYILPGGGAAAMNRNKLANGSDAKRRNKPGARPVVRQRGAHRPQVEAECATLFCPTLASHDDRIKNGDHTFPRIHLARDRQSIGSS